MKIALRKCWWLRSCNIPHFMTNDDVIQAHHPRVANFFHHQQLEFCTHHSCAGFPSEKASFFASAVPTPRDWFKIHQAVNDSLPQSELWALSSREVFNVAARGFLGGRMAHENLLIRSQLGEPEALLPFDRIPNHPHGIILRQFMRSTIVIIR